MCRAKIAYVPTDDSRPDTIIALNVDSCCYGVYFTLIQYGCHGPLESDCCNLETPLEYDVLWCCSCVVLPPSVVPCCPRIRVSL